MRTWLLIISSACWGIYLLLTSIYCLLAFLPYTYVALIKEPPYAWLPWFAQHQALLYFVCLTLLGISRWKRPRFGALAIFLIGGGMYVSLRPFLPSITDNWAAYTWSLISLLPVIAVAVMDATEGWPETSRDEIALLPPVSGGGHPPIHL